MGNPVVWSELYTPDIDWSTRTFTGPGSWATINESANVARGYHSVALLLPDGRVWTAGSSEAGVGGQYLPEYDVEVFSPWYVGTARPRILPSAARKRPPGRARTRKEGVDYGETFNIAVEGSISHVALMRCGSITHAYDTDTNADSDADSYAEWDTDSATYGHTESNTAAPADAAPASYPAVIGGRL